jgi:hypothetical protein
VTKLVNLIPLKATIITFGLMISSTIGAQLLNPLRDKAIKYHVSLTGTTPNNSEIDLIVEAIKNNTLREISKDIIESKNGFQNFGAFYNVTVRDFATPWSTEDGSPLSELNDMTATVVGFTRDDRPFNEILWRDSVYKAVGITFLGGQLKFFKGTSYPSGTSASKVCANVVTQDPTNQKYRAWYVSPDAPNSESTDENNTGCRISNITKKQLDDAIKENSLYVPALDKILFTNRIKESNNHYRSFERQGLDMSNREIFKSQTQMVKLHRSSAAIAGLLSTRAFGQAYYSAGTNRAALSYSMKYFFCKEMEELNDTSIPDFRNRRDVDRSPGGISTLYKDRCIGCHAGMDALAGAFAYYDFNGGGIVYNEGEVHTKMNHNAIFDKGFVTEDDSWMNLWNKGQNSVLGWGFPASGNGAKDFGRMMASSEAFPHCMSEQVFEKVCFRKPVSTADKELIKENTRFFKKNNYNMKNLFIETAVKCMD